MGLPGAWKVEQEQLMAHLFIRPPTKEEVVDQFADWIARLFRVEVTIILDDLSGSRHTVQIAHPDKSKCEQWRKHERCYCIVVLFAVRQFRYEYPRGQYSNAGLHLLSVRQQRMDAVDAPKQRREQLVEGREAFLSNGRLEHEHYFQLINTRKILARYFTCSERWGHRVYSER